MGFYLAVAVFLALALSLVLPTVVWLTAVLVIGIAWALRKILRPKPNVRPAGATEHRLETMRQWTPGPYSPDDGQVSSESWQARIERLNREMELAQQERYRQQFPEVLRLILSAEGYPAAKQAMQTVLTQYPHFSEAARHMQIVAESLSIIEKTKNRATLESRVEVVRTSQAAMFETLPFTVDPETQAAQNVQIDQVLQEGLARVPATESKPRKETTAASVRRQLMRERREQMLLNIKYRPLWQLRAISPGDLKNCPGKSFPVYRWDDLFWQKNGPWVCRKAVCKCSVRAYRLDDEPMKPQDSSAS